MKNGNKRMVRAMLIYGGVFAAVIIIGLLVLSGFMADYEKSRPDNVAKVWQETLGEDELKAMTADTVNTLNYDIMPEAECAEMAGDVIKEAKLSRVPQETTDDRKVYSISSEGTVLGKLILTADGKGFFGFPRYSASVEEMDLAGITAHREIVIPADWSVSMNGVLLDKSCIVDEQEYELFEEFYGDEDVEIPYLMVYDTGRYLSEPEIVIKDSKGNVRSELTEEIFVDNCDAAMQQAIMDEAKAFIEAYITYSSNVNKATYGNYLRLEAHMVKGSSLQVRMRAAAYGLGWASSLGDKLQSIDYHHFCDLGNGYWYCDLTYINDTHGTNGHVLTENNLKFVFTETEDGKLLAAAMCSY